jgi:hypothetical protein|tara:strand:+ start:39 stop:308 length:270 start_codon:yes stop_codon:yes gene_type:complete
MKDNIFFLVLISAASLYAIYLLYFFIKNKVKKLSKVAHQKNTIVSIDPFREEYKETLIQECEKRLKKAKFMNESDQIIFFENKLKKIKK